MKISLLEPIGVSEEIIEEYAKKIRAQGHEFQYFDKKTTDVEELKKRSKGSNIIMIANNPYPKEVIEEATELKMISVAFTGIDHIGTAACKERDIMICNAAGYSDQTVAELVIGMAVTALRKLKESDKLVRSGGTNQGIGGYEISGKTIGIIGLGHIGMKTAQLFQAFGANVIAYNHSQSEEAKKNGIEYKTLEEVLEKSDIISLHLPLNEQTKGFIDRECIQKMKKSAVFINCARGPIVDNVALADALNRDELAYACIDVYDMEPPIPENYPLLHTKNTFLTPHQAFISEESMIRRAEIVFRNVFRYLDGCPENVCKL